MHPLCLFIALLVCIATITIDAYTGGRTIPRYGFTHRSLVKPYTGSQLMMAKDILYDMPVSNHGARVRILCKAKGLDIEIKPPTEIGGLKSPEYLMKNAQGKMPLLVTSEGFSIPESDSIARYLMDKDGCDMLPKSIEQRSLCNQIVRIHDIYISPVQSSMYRAPGSIFGQFGKDRVAAINELKKQFLIIESTLSSFYALYPKHKSDSQSFYLCGDEMSYADATLFPTMIFCEYMLPRYFSTDRSEFMGPLLQSWFMTMNNNAVAREVKDEMLSALNQWSEKGRWDPIVEEMKSLT